jgi:DNA-binding CsgD family transcriptional regulator
MKPYSHKKPAMKWELFSTRTNKIWQYLAGGENINAPLDLRLVAELEFYKKMLTLVQARDTFYILFNFQTQAMDYVSKDVYDVLGYTGNEFTIGLFMEDLHPEDRAWFLNCQETAGKFALSLPVEKRIKYKLRIDYRLRKKSGEYIRVLHHTIVVQSDEEGNLLKSLVILTDITHLKFTGRPVMSYIGMDGEPSYFNVDVERLIFTEDSFLTKREQEILNYLAEGRSSKEIATLLKISKYTVDDHRKHLLQKMQVTTTTELVRKAIQEGMI